MSSEMLLSDLRTGPLKIERIRVMHGANYFSAGPVIIIRLNLGTFHEVFTNAIPDFLSKLKSSVPSLQQHHCSIGKEGGFFKRVEDGTLLGHVLEHLAIELQTLAGMDVAYGKTRSTLSPGVYHVIYRFFDEEAGIYAGKAAFNLLNAMLEGEETYIGNIISELIEIRERRLLGPTTQAIVKEAENRRIPWLRLDDYNLIQLGTACYRKHLRATITSDTSQIAVETTDDQFLCLKILDESGIPVPETIRTKDPSEALTFFETHQSGIVIKPSESRLGTHVTTGIHQKGEILPAFNLAALLSPEVLVQQYIEGGNYRLLIVDYKFVAASHLTPPSITGDGQKTVLELIENINSNPLREKGDKGCLSLVEADAQTLRLLEMHGLTLQDIPKEGHKINLKNSGNPLLGGFTEDVTEIVHPDTIFLAERAAKVCGLNIAGVDILCKDISSPIKETGGVILEINASPGLRMHIKPAKGKARNVADSIIAMLFPKGSKTRIPLIAVTGAGAETLCCEMIEYVLMESGFNTGSATAKGLKIQGSDVLKEDARSAYHAALLMKDPMVNAAVIEVSLESILEDGLGYPFADVGVFLNASPWEDNYDDLECVEDMVYAQSVVVEEITDEGFSVLNADDPLILETLKRISTTCLLFGRDTENPQLAAHIKKGGRAIVLNESSLLAISGGQPEILISKPDWQNVFSSDTNQIDAVLGAIAALWALNIRPERSIELIKKFQKKI